MRKSFKSLILVAICLFAATSYQAEAKKFQRALVIAGGGISPGVALGILAAAEERGWIPDVVITTCGSSLSTSIYNAYKNSRDSLAYAQSPVFHQGLAQIRIQTPDVRVLQSRIEHMERNHGTIPPVFDKVIMSLPNAVEMSLPDTRFNSGTGPRFVMIGAKASFGPGDVGKQINGKIFTEVFFTDPDTAQALQGFQSTLPANSYVASQTQTLTNVSTQDAVRNSIADPLFLNPSILNGSYFFTGAIDLYPLDVAHFLADEVIATYPISLFKDYEDTAFKSAFGFTQTSRAVQAVTNNRVKWIDLSGVEPLRFDPTNSGLTLYSRVPAQLGAFQQGIQAQFNFGRERMAEALAVQSQGPSRKHLRAPINPKLAQSFTCANAYVWTTDKTTRECANDAWAGCDRKSAGTCTPVR